MDIMTYDATAQKLAVKVIGTVESNLNYSAVNYGDPITVGIAQWYGVRAAALLCRLRDQNPGAWYGVEASIASQLQSIAPDNTWWNTRRLTTTEGNSLAGPLSRNAGTQNQQLTEDLDGYKAVAVAHGMDPDADTAAMIFFFTMYHQGPVYAFQVLDAAGAHPSLDQLFTACMGNPVLGQYGGRYRTARDLINAGDTTGTDPAPTPAPTVANGNARYIRVVGDNLLARFGNGEDLLFYPTGHGTYVPRAAKTDPTPTQPPPPADNGAWTLPLSGAVTMSSGYGPRPTPAGTADINAGFHYGCDFIPANGGTPDVVAPCPMVVTVAYDGTGPDPSSGTAGRYVKGHSTDGAYTFNFFHMTAGSVAVAVGDTLTRGQKIGVMGGTGNVTGPHLHFETYKGVIDSPWPPPYGNPVDPIPVLRSHGVSV
jgi:murein DD-endopeptidase MepM/ murein hydrolase activator NlpD